MEDKDLWLRHGGSKPSNQLEQFHPRRQVRIESSPDWRQNVLEQASQADQITIRNFECSLENLAFADDVVLRHKFQWRFSGTDLILERVEVRTPGENS